MRSLIICLLVLAVSGCSSNDSQQIAKTEGQKSTKEKIGYECETIPVLGTSIPKKVCTTRVQREDMEKNAKKNVDKIRKGQIACKITDTWCN